MNGIDFSSHAAASNRKVGRTSVRILAELDKETLILTTQGFVLVFQERTLELINRQLRDFDAEEWRPAIEDEKTFSREFDGLAPISRFRNAADILAACSEESLSLLNHEILAITGPNFEFYNLLHSTNPFRVKARLQALNVLPMLKWEFYTMSRVSDRVRRRIDSGKSVWDAFLEMHPGKACILRRIASAKSSPEAWRGDLAGLLALLDPLPPEKIPSSELEWNAFHSIYLGLGLNRVPQQHYENYEERLEIKLFWMAESARIGWQKAYEKLTAIEGGLGAICDSFDFLDEIRDAGNYIAKKAGEEIASADDWKKRSRERWLKAPKTLGMFRILECSVRWHRSIWEDAGLPLSIDTKRNVWPCLFEQPVELSPNVYAVSLGNADALALEGRHLGHCVGNYWMRCFLGDSHIISLRDSNGDSLSTLEIQIAKDDSCRCEIIQHRGKQNQTPDQALRALEGRLKALIISQADFKELAKWRKGAAKIEGIFGANRSHSLSKGYDERRFERLAAVLGRDRLLGLFKQ